jgi:hypothetical protein
MLIALAFEQKPSMVEIAGILVGTGQAVALPSDLTFLIVFNSITKSRTLETVVNQEISTLGLASPVLCSSLNINTVEAVVYKFDCFVVDDDDLLSQAPMLLLHFSHPIAIVSKIVTEPEETTNALKECVEWSIKKRLPPWKQLIMI